MDNLKLQLSLSIRARYPLIYLVTSEETRAEEALEEVGRTTGKEVVTWSCSKGFQPPQGDAKKSTQPEEALKYIDASDKKAVFVLKDFHPYLEEPKILRLMRDLVNNLKRSYKTVLLVSPVLKIPPELEKDITVHDMPLPDANELAEVLNNLLEPYRKFSKADLPRIINEKKQLIRKSGILDFIGLSTTLSNVGGLGKLKEWLKERGGAFSNKAREYGLPEPKGLLMLGVQGCGKSLAAKAIASEWNLPLLRLDVGQIFDSYIGNSEANMRKAIALAEAMSPTVLWLDEIEKGFSGLKGSGGDSGVTLRVFGTFLTWMQEKIKPVFVIATANDIESLPPELLRKGRFDEIFFIDLPTAAERKIIFDIHFGLKKRDSKKYDVDRLAKEADQFSGAEIEQAILSAMYRAFAENREFTTEDVLQSIKETVPLAVTASEKITHLRQWAHKRARPSS